MALGGIVSPLDVLRLEKTQSYDKIGKKSIINRSQDLDHFFNALEFCKTHSSRWRCDGNATCFHNYIWGICHVLYQLNFRETYLFWAVFSNNLYVWFLAVGVECTPVAVGSGWFPKRDVTSITLLETNIVLMVQKSGKLTIWHALNIHVFLVFFIRVSYITGGFSRRSFETSTVCTCKIKGPWPTELSYPTLAHLSPTQWPFFRFDGFFVACFFFLWKRDGFQMESVWWVCNHPYTGVIFL